MGSIPATNRAGISERLGSYHCPDPECDGVFLFALARTAHYARSDCNGGEY